MILITGFEPFGGSLVNPSQAAAEALHGQTVGGVLLHSLILPVDGLRGPRVLLEAVEALQPRAVVCLGEAARRTAISVERVAINLLDYRIADNTGVQVVDQPVVAGGCAAYFATLPTRAMVEAVTAAGIPAELSYNAGTFLCNQVMYVLLHHAAVERTHPLIGGFIHLPLLPEQAARSAAPLPSMSADTMLAGLRAAIEVVASQEVIPA